MKPKRFCLFFAKKPDTASAISGILFISTMEAAFSDTLHHLMFQKYKAVFLI
jgi:hypothetical protein